MQYAVRMTVIRNDLNANKGNGRRSDTHTIIPAFSKSDAIEMAEAINHHGPAIWQDEPGVQFERYFTPVAIVYTMSGKHVLTFEVMEDIEAYWRRPDYFTA